MTFFAHNYGNNGWITDMLTPGELVDITATANSGGPIETGEGTIVLPPEMTLVTAWALNGPVASIENSGQTVTVKLDRLPPRTGDNMAAFVVRIRVRMASLVDFPEIAPTLSIPVSGQFSLRDGGSTVVSDTYTAHMLYARITMTADPSGPVEPGDIITYRINVAPYPHLRIVSSLLSLPPAYGTDIVPGSVQGSDGVVSDAQGNISISHSGSLPTSVSYQVKVRELWALPEGMTEIENSGASLSLTVESTAPTSKPGDHHRVYSFRTPAVLQPIERDPPPLRLSIEIPESRYQIGDTFTASARVTTNTDETLIVSFDDPLLAEWPLAGEDDILEVDAVELPEPFELSREDPSRSFDVPVKVLHSGLTEIVSSLSYTGSAGASGSLEATEEVRVPPLVVSLEARPLVDDVPILNLEIDEEGRVTDKDGNAVAVKVEVTVKNEGDRPVVARLQSLEARARDRTPLGARVAVTGTFPLNLGTIEPGHSVSQEFAIEIAADGRFEFAAIATGTLAGSTRQQNAAGRGAPLAVGVPYPVEIELDFVRTPVITNQNSGAFVIQPGGSLEILASVSNLTSNSTLEFYGMRAEKRFNAFGAVLSTVDGRMFDPPFAHDHEVNAQAALVLGGYILTEADGAPSGLVRWLGLEDAVMVDDETGDEWELEDDDILITSRLGSWDGDPLTIRLVQDYSRPFAPPSLSVLETTAVWSHGALLGVGQWTYDTIDTIGGIGRLAGYNAADPSLLHDAMGAGSRAVWEAAELAAVTWEGMSEAERMDFVRAASTEVARRAYLFSTTRAPFDPEDVQAAIEFTRAAIYGLFGGVSDAYASDDPAEIAAMWGRVSGQVGMEVVAGLMPTPQFTQYTRAADAARLADNASLGAAFTSQELFLRGVRSGAVDEATTIRNWGLGGQHLQDVKDLFRRFGVKGYMRERSPEAYRLIDLLGEAVWKPEAMKPKGLNDLDLLILNYDLPPITGKPPQNALLEPKGITAVFMPEPDDVLRARLRSENYSDAVVEAAISRAKSRREEFEKFVPEFESWSRPVSEGGGIPVAMNYVDNGVPNPSLQPGPNRQFRFDRHRREGKPTVYVPQMMNADGTAYRYISGDIDWIHFSFLDGSPLDPEIAFRLYDAMSRCCGLQHPETISWIRDGQTVFRTKINQIGEYLRGEKALLEVSGETTRAVRVSQNLSRFAADGRNHLIFFDGGIKSRARATLAEIESAFSFYQKRFPDLRLATPFLWMVRAGEEALNSTIDGREWSFSASEDAVLARQGRGATIEVFDGTSWIPRTLDQLPTPIALTPATGLSSAVSAGTSVLPILELPAMWSAELANAFDIWFAAGQTVVIAPGESTQEVRRITALGSLILDHPLIYDHPEGTTVAVLTAALQENLVEMPTGPWWKTTAAPADDAASFELYLPPNHGFRVDTRSGDGDWQALDRLSVVSGGVSHDVIYSEYAGQPIVVRFPASSAERTFRFSPAHAEGSPTHAALTFFAAWDPEGDHWMGESSGFGWIYAEHYPWLYHLDEEWLYAFDNAEGFHNGAWFYHWKNGEYWHLAGQHYPWVFIYPEGWMEHWQLSGE